MGKKGQIYFIYVITFILAACSILYELIIAQAISALAANTVVRYSLTIGFYLGAMGMGALLCNRIFGKDRDWASLFRVEVLLSIAGGLSAMVVHFAHMIYGYMFLHNLFEKGIAVFFLISFIIVTAVGFLTGLELPLIIRISNNYSGQKKITNRVLAVDYFGCLAGGLLFPLLLLPYLEVLTISFVTALLNLAVALAILFVSRKGSRQFIINLAVNTSLLVILAAGFINVRGIQQYFLKKYYYYQYSENLIDLFKPAGNLPGIERISSPYQKIDIVKCSYYKEPFTPGLINAYSTKHVEDENYPREYYLFLNGDYQFWTDTEEIYHEYFAHIPIILNGRIPRRVLVLGAGDGLLNRELLKYPGIESITLVDIDKKMVDTAKVHPVLSYINKGSLEDSRVEVKIADGYQYVKNTTEKYDAIYIDFPDPADYNLSKLYSREFYHFVRECLSQNGYAVIDSPGTGHFSQFDFEDNQEMDPENNWQIFYNTLGAAGFGTIIPYVTNLETDNQRAAEILKKFKFFITRNIPGGGADEFMIDDEEKRAYLIKQMVQIHVWSMQRGFIMMKNEAGQGGLEYKDYGIKLHVLNKKRFKLAFALSDKFSREKDEKKVNSIMRPTLPDTPFWFVRLPY